MTTATEIGWRFFVEKWGAIYSQHGDLKWPLPNDQPGVWMDFKGQCQLCKSGLHASPTIFDALQERQGYILGKVEAQGIQERDETKFSARSMRVLTLYEKEHIVGLAVLAAIMCFSKSKEKVSNDEKPLLAINGCLNWIENPSNGNDDWARAVEKRAEGLSESEIGALEKVAWRTATYAEAATARTAFCCGDRSRGAAWAVAAAVAAASAAAIGTASTEWAEAVPTFIKNFNGFAEQLLELPKNKLADFLEEKLNLKDNLCAKNA